MNSRFLRLLSGFRAIGLGIIAISLGMVVGAGTSSQQDQGKVFKKDLSFIPEPIQLIEIKTGSQTVRFPDELQSLTAPAAKQKLPTLGEKWSFDSTFEMSLKETRALKIKEVSSIRPYIEVQVENNVDWLKGATFRLKNKSDKNIKYISLQLLFPETRLSGPLMGWPIQLGRLPHVASDLIDPLLIKPEEEIELKITDKIYNGLVEYLNRRQPIANINRADILLSLTVFEDGTAWNDGEYFLQDPNNPHTFIPAGYKPPK